MKKITLILIVILHLPFVLFSRELTLMHDKGGTPNYQPYFEEISKVTGGIDLPPGFKLPF